MVEKNRSGETFCLAKHLTLPNGAIFIAIFAVIIALLMFLVFKCETSSEGKCSIILPPHARVGLHLKKKLVRRLKKAQSCVKKTWGIQL